MGMPAATITSMTAHGGTVILGFPMVMINFMPASRITDMHVCPMVTVLVPHVGGPFILGSMTVLTGMMPQSRVTDELVCVGPPDVCVMGAETVLVGEAGAGGAGAAMAGIVAMGASVPTAAQAAAVQNQPTAQLQQDGTIQTSAPPGGSLPAIPLNSPGFPTLPPSQTPNFENAKPVDIPPGTTLYSVVGDPASGGASYWTTDPPTDETAWRQGCSVGNSNPGSILAVAQVPPGGLKAWMGAAAGQAAQGLLGGANQVWVPPGSLNPSSLVPTAWTGAVQQAEQSAKQAVKGAQQAANQATQAAKQAEQQAQQAVQQGEQAAKGAGQQLQQQVQQTATQVQQAADQAKADAKKAVQQGQQAVQQAQQAVKGAEQQAQQAAQSGKAAAQKAVQQAQQTEQQVQQQAKAATQQAMQAANQAQQAANQATQAAQQAGKQAGQAAQSLPKGF